MPLYGKLHSPYLELVYQNKFDATRRLQRLKYVIWWLILLYWVKPSCSAMVMHYKQYVTNWTTLKKIWKKNETKSEKSGKKIRKIRKIWQQSIMRCRSRELTDVSKNVVPIIPSDVNAPWVYCSFPERLAELAEIVLWRELFLLG